MLWSGLRASRHDSKEGHVKNSPATFVHFNLTGPRRACDRPITQRRARAPGGEAMCPGHSHWHDLGPWGAAPFPGLSKAPRSLKVP